MRFIILLSFNIIIILINYYPKINFNKEIKKQNYDKFKLDKNIISTFYSFRSYIYYLRSKNLKYDFMDKIKFYKYLQANKLPHAKILYMSDSNFNVKSKLDNLLNNNISFVVKPSHLSEKISCFVIKNKVNILNNKKVTSEFMQKKISNYVNLKALKTESLLLKNVNPGVIIQESLDIFEEINEWKCFCVWGEIIFIIWRISHKNDVIIMNNKFERYNIGFHNYNLQIPNFLKNINKVTHRLSKNIPFLRIDILWNKHKYIINEIDICPSGYYGFHNERLLIDLIKMGYNIRSRNFKIEIMPYLNFLINRTEYFLNILFVK